MLTHDENTNAALAAKLGKQPQNISAYLGALKENQCIILSRITGREKFYSVAEWIKWLRLKPEPGAQSKISQY
jgi:hypothetical protein